MKKELLTELTNLPQLQQFNFPTAFSVFIVLFFFIYVLLFSDLYIPSTIHSIRENHESIELFAHKTVPVCLGHFVWDVYALCTVHIVDCLNRWLVHSNTHTHTDKLTAFVCSFICLSLNSVSVSMLRNEKTELCINLKISMRPKRLRANWLYVKIECNAVCIGHWRSCRWWCCCYWCRRRHRCYYIVHTIKRVKHNRLATSSPSWISIGGGVLALSLSWRISRVCTQLCACEMFACLRVRVRVCMGLCLCAFYLFVREST